MPIYERRGDLPRLAACYEQLANQPATDHERLDYLLRLSAISQEQFGASEIAFNYLADAYLLSPSSLQIRDELENVAEKAGLWAELIGIFEKRLDSAPDAKEAEFLLTRMAKIAEHRLSDCALALDYVDRLTQLRPSEAAVQSELERLCERANNWERLADLYRAIAERATTEDERFEYAFRTARLQEEKLGDLDLAIESYCALHERNPDDARVSTALRRLYASRSEWTKIGDMLRRELAHVNDPARRHTLLSQLAELLETKGDRPEDAFELREELLSLPGPRASTVNVLEQWLSRDATERVRAAELLVPIYEEQENFDGLAEALEVILGVTELKRDRYSILERLVEIYDTQLGRPKDAAKAAARLLDIDPKNPRLIERAIEHATNAKDLHLLNQLLLSVSTADGYVVEPESELRVRREIADILLAHSPNNGEAQSHLARILELEPSDLQTASRLAGVLRHVERWHELDHLYDALLDSGQRDLDGIDLRLARAELHGLRLGRIDSALSILKDIALEGPTHERTIGLLESLLGKIATGYLPSSTNEALQRSIDAIVELLGNAYAAKGSWKQQIGMLFVVERTCVSDEPRLAILKQISTLQEEKLHDPAAALNTVHRALLIAPTDQSLQRWVERLGSELGQWHAVATVWAETLTRISPQLESERITLLYKLAAVQHEHLADLGAAANTYREIVGSTSKDPERARHAIAALADIYRQTNRTDELAELLKRQAEIATSEEDRPPRPCRACNT